MLKLILLLKVFMNNLYNTNANKEKDDLISSLKELKLKGYFDFENISNVAFDFGNTYHLQPMAVLYPKTVNDISTTIKHVFKNGNVYPQLTITARGHAHSLQAQSQNQGAFFFFYNFIFLNSKLHILQRNKNIYYPFGC